MAILAHWGYITLMPTPVDNLPTLTVIIVVRNAAGTITRALDSVIAQRYPKLDLAVWDGASDDGTLEILKRYSPYITTLKSARDDGPVDGFNHGMQLAKGDYMSFLNADDEYEPGVLWAVADAIMKNPGCQVVSCGLLNRRWDRQGNPVVTGYYAGAAQLELTLERILSDLPTFALSRFIARELYWSVGPYDPALYISCDRDWMIRLILRRPSNVIIPRALYAFTVDDHSISSRPDHFLRIIEEHIIIAQRLLEREDLNEQERKAVLAWQQHQIALGFWKALAQFNPGKALKLIRKQYELSGWRGAIATCYVLLKKLCKRFGLKLCNGIDRG